MHPISIVILGIAACALIIKAGMWVRDDPRVIKQGPKAQRKPVSITNCTDCGCEHPEYLWWDGANLCNTCDINRMKEARHEDTNI